MINLRYHIVSLTAVFLAIGIGLTLGSTFLDRATVDNLNGQLENLETRLGDREEQVQELERQLEREATVSDALDEQATGLLSGALTDVPVVVIAGRGADEDDVQGAVATLVASDAAVQGIWWLSERWALDDDGEVTALATALGSESSDPSRLRRMAITELGTELRARQLVSVDEGDEEPVDGDLGTGGDPGDDEITGTSVEGEDTEVTSESAPDAGADDGQIDVLDALVEGGFIEFEAVAGGPGVQRFPDGSRILFAAGSPDVPDDLVIEPLIERMGRATDTPVRAVVGSAMAAEGATADAVEVIRQDETLVELVSTVDTLDGFAGWAAMVLALADVGDGVVGHYGVGEGASRLLPPLRSP